MDLKKIYLDTSLLIGCFVWLAEKNYHKRPFPLSFFVHEKEKPYIMAFLSEQKDVQKFISIASKAEIISVLKYDEKFRKYNFSDAEIESLISLLQTIIGFNIIIDMKIGETIIKGNLITDLVIEYTKKCGHVLDCIHVDMARTNDLTFVTSENKLGKIKDLYERIMTENKYTSQKLD